MNQKSNDKLKLIFGIIFIAIIILGVVYVKFSDNQSKVLNDNQKQTEELNSTYSNIDIDTSKLNIFFFNVGQADSSLILYKDKVILIDAGNDSDGDKIVEFLKANKITQIDYLIGTHIHEDHIGGIPDIVNNISVKTIYMPTNTSTKDNFYEEVLDSIKDNNLSITAINQEDCINLSENFLFKILYVDNNEPKNLNNASIIIQLEYETQKYLFMGDAEKEVENRLLSAGILEDIDVLKVRTSWFRNKFNRGIY